MCDTDWYDDTGLNFGRINIFVFVTKDLSNIFLFLQKRKGQPKPEGLPLAHAPRFSGIKSMAYFSGLLVFYWALFFYIYIFSTPL
jgi:hypothetical protein